MRARLIWGAALAVMAAGCGSGRLIFDIDVFSFLSAAAADTLPYVGPLPPGVPDTIPVQNVVMGDKKYPPRGEKVWILWTHLGADYCVNELDEVRSRARNWQVVHEGYGRGLALAEF